MKIVLINPMIPQNTGSISRTCFALDLELHLIKPYGFELSAKYLKRCSVQHWDKVTVKEFESWKNFLERENPSRNNLCLFTEHGEKSFYEGDYSKDSYLIFGPESADFPRNLIAEFRERTFYLPMVNVDVRCLNLSNVVTAAAYQAFGKYGC